MITKIIGIVPSTLGFDTTNPFDDKYYVQDTYIKSLKKYNCIPIILAPSNLEIDKRVLKLCDAFLLIGGKNIHNYHYDVIEYALETNKKLLGICLGMQAIASFSNDRNELKTLTKIDNHYYDKVTHNNKELLIHNITLEKDSLLNKLLGNELKVNSIHKYRVKKVSKHFRIVGTFENVIEGIEYKNIIGVQFHPELMSDGEKLFEWLTR